ncbi:MAG: Nif11-like leader peptide family RiPP precursor [Clostridia bacterium]|nr:Nif11-like leader peptide family RiPP precursor [Clostridia bacterium]
MTSEKLTQEFIKKVSMAKSPEEIVALAKENGMEFSEEKAKALFAHLNGSGELSDDDLSAVAGGYNRWWEWNDLP